MNARDSASLLRLLRFVVVAAMAWSLVMAAAFFWWAGGEVRAALRAPSASLMAAILVVFVLYQVLRFVRWDLMLRAEGYAVPWARGFSIFLAGFALTPTPAKAGVAARSLLLLPEGVPVHVSLAAYFAERLLDLIGLVLLAALLFGRDAGATRWLVLGALSVAAIAGVVAAPEILRRSRGAFARWPRIDAALGWTIQCFADASGMLAPRRLPLFIALGAISNAIAGVLLWASLRDTATPIDVATGIGVIATSHLSGSISMLPGGLGGFDLAMIAQLDHAGVAASDAIVALMAVRLATFWSGVAVGLPLLWMGLRRSYSR